MKASELLKRYEKQRHTSATDDRKDKEHHPEEDHSLEAQARERARHPREMHAGTAFDWEDLERYQKELDRLDREGPKTSHDPDKQGR